MEDEKTTDEIMACKSFEELEAVIEKRAPIISFSRNEPVSHSAHHLKGNIHLIRNHDFPTNRITRACGIRATVEKLLKNENR